MWDGADFVKIDEDSYALAYRTYNLSRWMAKVKTFTISSDGKSIVQESEQEVFEGKTGGYIGESISLLKMDSDNLLLPSTMKITMGISKAMRYPMVERPSRTTGILSLKRTIRATIPPKVLRRSIRIPISFPTQMAAAMGT